MKKIYQAALAVLFLTLIISAAPCRAEAVELDWQPYTQGLDGAKKAGKPSLVYFFADWCTYCKKMDKETFGDEEVSKYLSGNFSMVRVNTDKAKEVAQSYGVQGLPTVWFLNEKGEKLGTLPGFVPPRNFLAAAKYIGSSAYKTMKFEEFVEKDRQGK